MKSKLNTFKKNSKRISVNNKDLEIMSLISSPKD